MPYARSCAIDQVSRLFALPTGLPSDHPFHEVSTSNLPNSFDRVGENHLLWSSTRRTCSAKLNAQKVTMNTAKDLTKEPPRCLCERIGGYAERSDLPVMQNESAYGAGNTTKSLVGSAGRPLINGKGDIFANFKTFSKAIPFHQRTGEF